MFIPYPHNLRGVVGVLVGVILCMIWIMYVNLKSKSAYASLTSPVISLKRGTEHYRFRDNKEFRYLKIQGYKYPFEIYISNDKNKAVANTGVDAIETGDTITIYFYETDNTREAGINRFVQFIDKDGKMIFKRSGIVQTVGMFTIGLCVITIIVTIELYRRKKIPF